MKTTILVSNDNGNSTTIIRTEAAAALFLDLYGVENALTEIRDAGLECDCWDDDLEVLKDLAKAAKILARRAGHPQPNDCIPTLP